MSETVVVTTDPGETITPYEIADAVTDAVEETPPSETADAIGEASAAVADAVGDAVAETVAAVENSRAIETATDNGEILRRLDELGARVESLAVQPEPEPVEETVEIEDDEIVPNKTHPWFRPMREWHGE